MIRFNTPQRAALMNAMDQAFKAIRRAELAADCTQEERNAIDAVCVALDEASNLIERNDRKAYVAARKGKVQP